MARPKAEEPTLEEYFNAALDLARLVRAAFDKPGSVKRSKLKAALVRFEKLDYRAM